MSDALLLHPDIDFIQSVMASGGEDLKKCMQCGTCSAVCALAPEDAAFPRKQMFEAQWGLKDRLVADPAIWLCHNCGDCTSYCPRGARPGDVFTALRRQAIEHFAYPRFMGRIVANPKALIALFLAAALVFWTVALWAPKSGPTPGLEFANVFPIPVLEALFFSLSGLVLVAFGAGLARFAKALKTSGAGVNLPAGLGAVLVEIGTHARFSKCGKNENQRLGHLLAFWGFLGLAFMGTAVGIGTMAGLVRTPLALGNPWKIFANFSAVVALAGCLILLLGRIRDPEKRAASAYFDWFFLLTLTGVVMTGIFSELLRLTQATRVMYGIYFVHLVLIFVLFLSAPYSKFAHLLYRTVAMGVMKTAKAQK